MLRLNSKKDHYLVYKLIDELVVFARVGIKEVVSDSRVKIEPLEIYYNQEHIMGPDEMLSVSFKANKYIYESAASIPRKLKKRIIRGVLKTWNQ